jgi:hypothetical protein
MNTQDTAKIESKQPYKYGDIQKLLREIGQWHEKYRDAHVGATADGKDPITMVKDYVDAILTTAIEEAYKRGRLAEIEANATADITIAQDKAEQIREEAYNLGYKKGKSYRDAIEGSIPQSMIDQQVVLAEAEGYKKGYNAGLADGTDKPLLAIEQIRAEVRREVLEEVYAGARHYSFGFSKPLGFKGMCSPDVNRTLVPIEHIDSLIYKKTQ